MRLYPAVDVSWPAAPDQSTVERLLAALDDFGPVAVEDSPVGVRLYFETAAARDAALEVAAATLADAACSAVDVPDDDWAARSQASLTCVRVGRLVVCPPWDVPSVEELTQADLLPVLIRPAMGFGTGHHATTRLCLALLQEEPATLERRRVLDIGTGSGVLALAAWRLGALEVLAVDHDDDALTSARESAELNAAGRAVRFAAGDLDDLTPLAAADVVLANLTGALLVRSAGRIAALCDGDGPIILSGILDEEAAEVTAAFLRHGWQIVSRRQEDEWVGLRLAVTSPSAPRAR